MAIVESSGQGIRAALAGALALLLAACSSSGDIDIGSGQDADPGTVDFPVAYVKRTIPGDGDDLRQQRDTAPDADLYFRDRASPSSSELNITACLRASENTRLDIRDVDVSPDARRIIFSMRGPLGQNQDERDAPFWEIWEYQLGVALQCDAGQPNPNPRRVIVSDIIAASGNDVSPQYLPDGRIVFSSTRQAGSKAILLDEGKPGFEDQVGDGQGNESAFLLHVMNADGTDIHQITYNQSHDLWPTVLADGRILFTRWDQSTGRGMHLYTVNPDGTDLQLLYGARSHQTGTPSGGEPTTIQFSRPREMQNGRILALVRPFDDTDFGGDLTLIDAATYVENTQALAAWAGLPGPAQSRATPNEVSTVPGPSRGGRFRSAYPLWDGSNRILVSWSVCRLLDATVTPAVIVPCTAQRLADPDVETAPPLYSAFVFDPAGNTFRPLFQPVEGVMVTDVVAAQPRTPPVVRLDKTLPGEDFDPALVPQGVGVLEIRSVYDFDGTVRNAGGATSLAAAADPLRTAAQRPARFLRIEKAVSIGDNDLNPDFPDLAQTAFGASGFMREILGYIPVEPDGSVSARVPANTAFVISVVDAEGRRVAGFPQHRNWLQLRPGEVRRCNGCHQQVAGQPDRSHGRDGTSNPADAAWGAPFPNTLAATAAAAVPGDSMARARARTSCTPGNPCSQIPSVNLLYDDVWTDPSIPGMRPPDDSTALTYGSASGFNTTPPVRAGCMSAWSGTCRIVINYVQHVHPLWYVDRGAGTCTNCHTPVDEANANAARVPAGQLDLSDVDSQEVPAHKQAYRELLFGDNEQELVGGVLQDRLVQNGVDEAGNPILVPVAVPRSLVPQNARGSGRFFDRFAQATGTVDHRDFLTPAELRLISEWVDIGAQYFNDPFADGIPVN